jgi:hypothetical protein
VYEITVQLDPNVPNSEQGDSASATFTWQANNAGSG